MRVRSLNELRREKKTRIAVFLGCGPSINDVTEEQWKCLTKYDIWAVNNWIYHPTIVPDFYHVELKHYDFDIMKRRIEEKEAQYRNTNFILPKKKSFDLCPVGYKIYTYVTKSRDPKRTHVIFNADYKPAPGFVLTKSYDMSITAIFELLYNFKYELVYIIGIDLYDSRYFWTGGKEEYGEVHHQWNKEHENKDINLPHNTYKIKDYIVDFNKRWMLSNGRKICVGHKNTLLYPEIEYLSSEKLW